MPPSVVQQLTGNQPKSRHYKPFELVVTTNQTTIAPTNALTKKSPPKKTQKFSFSYTTGELGLSGILVFI